MEIIRSGFGEYVDNPTGGSAKLRIIACRLYLELLHGVYWWTDDGTAHVPGSVRRAIQHDGLGATSPASHVEVGPKEISPDVPTTTIAEVWTEHRSWRQSNQPQRIPQIERKVFNLLLRNDLSQRC